MEFIPQRGIQLSDALLRVGLQHGGFRRRSLDPRRLKEEIILRGEVHLPTRNYYRRPLEATIRSALFEAGYNPGASERTGRIPLGRRLKAQLLLSADLREHGATRRTLVRSAASCE